MHVATNNNETTVHSLRVPTARGLGVVNFILLSSSHRSWLTKLRFISFASASRRAKARHYRPLQSQYFFTSNPADVDRLEAECKTVVVVMFDKLLAGIVALRDEPREDAAEGIAR